MGWLIRVGAIKTGADEGTELETGDTLGGVEGHADPSGCGVGIVSAQLSPRKPGLQWHLVWGAPNAPAKVFAETQWKQDVAPMKFW